MMDYRPEWYDSAKHRAELEAEESTRLPRWWWLAAPAVIAVTVLVSMRWPMGWAS